MFRQLCIFACLFLTQEIRKCLVVNSVWWYGGITAALRYHFFCNSITMAFMVLFGSTIAEVLRLWCSVVAHNCLNSNAVNASFE